MLLKNTENSFGLIARSLHWIMAILIFGMLILGLYMIGLPISLEKLKLYGWHKEWGFVVLGLLIIRLVWRAINVTPNLSLPLLEHIAARLVHWAFYLLLIAMPLTGWLMSSASGVSVSFFG